MYSYSIKPNNIPRFQPLKNVRFGRLNDHEYKLLTALGKIKTALAYNQLKVVKAEKQNDTAPVTATFQFDNTDYQYKLLILSDDSSNKEFIFHNPDKTTHYYFNSTSQGTSISGYDKRGGDADFDVTLSVHSDVQHECKEVFDLFVHQIREYNGRLFPAPDTITEQKTAPF